MGAGSWQSEVGLKGREADPWSNHVEQLRVTRVCISRLELVVLEISSPLLGTAKPIPGRTYCTRLSLMTTNSESYILIVLVWNDELGGRSVSCNDGKDGRSFTPDVIGQDLWQWVTCKPHAGRNKTL